VQDATTSRSRVDRAEWSLPMNIGILNEELAYWQQTYNWDRIHGTIGSPPIDKLCSLLDKTSLWEEVIKTYAPKKNTKIIISKVS